MDKIKELQSRLKDTEREKKVLSSLVQSQESQYFISEKVVTDFFTNEYNRYICSVLRTLHGENRTINIQSVKDYIYLTVNKGTDKILEAYNEIFEYTESLDIETDIQYLKNLHINRVLYENISQATGKMFVQGIETERITEHINKQLINLESDIVEFQQTKDVAKVVVDKILNPQEDDYGLKTGLKQFDRLFKGVKEDRVITIGASPSIGKTAVVIDLLYRLMIRYPMGVEVCFFSLEMSEEDIMQRLYSRYTGLDSDVLAPENHKKLTDIQRDIILDAYNACKDFNLRIYYTNFSSSELKRTGEKFIRETPGKKRIFVLDHIGEVEGGGKKLNEETDEIMNVFKSFCRKYKSTCFVLTQLKKDMQDKSNAVTFFKPSNAYIMNSIGIEAKSNVVILLWRPEHYGIKSIPYDDKNISTIGKMFFVVTKNRGGKVGTIFFDCNIATNELSDYTEDNENKLFD